MTTNSETIHPDRSDRSGEMMRVCQSVSLALAGLVLLAGCNKDAFTSASLEEQKVESADVVERGVPPLTEAEIRIYLGGSTLTHQGETRTWYVYLSKDGRLEGFSETEDKATERARGTWRVTSEGQICRQWDNDWGGGTDGCAEVYRFGDEYAFVTPGQDPEGDDVQRRRRSAGNAIQNKG